MCLWCVYFWKQALAADSLFAAGGVDSSLPVWMKPVGDAVRARSSCGEPSAARPGGGWSREPGAGSWAWAATWAALRGRAAMEAPNAAGVQTVIRTVPGPGSRSL